MVLAFYSLVVCGRKPSQHLRKVFDKVSSIKLVWHHFLISKSIAKTQGDGNQLGGVLIVEPEDHVGVTERTELEINSALNSDFNNRLKVIGSVLELT